MKKQYAIFHCCSLEQNHGGESESFQRGRGGGGLLEGPSNETKLDLVEEVGLYDLRMTVHRGKVRGVS